MAVTETLRLLEAVAEAVAVHLPAELVVLAQEAKVAVEEEAC